MPKKACRRKYQKKKHSKQGRARKREKDRSIKDNDVNYKLYRRIWL